MSYSGNCDLIFGSITGSKNGKKLQDGVILNREHAGKHGPSRVRTGEDFTDDEDMSNYHRIRVRVIPAEKMANKLSTPEMRKLFNEIQAHEAFLSHAVLLM